MRDYFIRRLLLIPPTLLGVTFIVFSITRAVPGGPLARALQEAQKASEGGGSSSGGQMSGGMNEEQVEEAEEEYGYDKSVFVAYLQWLGVVPRERRLSKAEFRELDSDKVGGDLVEDAEKEVIVVLKGSGRQAKVVRDGTTVKSATYVDGGGAIADGGWKLRVETVEDRQKRWAKRNKKDLEAAPQNYDDRIVAYKTRFAGLLQGDLGRSRSFGDPVWTLIKGRIPIALYFGILTAIITYGICLPLGIVKAIKHRTHLDNLTSILVFGGYAIPGYALGALLVVFVAARWEWFPMGGFHSDEFEELSAFGKVKDLVYHSVLPLICYLVSAFAFVTMLMKNHLMDNLAADYIRTAIAKGNTFRKAVVGHAMRNSMIPLATYLGGSVTLFVTGSFLIETIFDIDGFGLLGYTSIIDRDYPVVMGVLLITAFLILLGNILSDMLVALVDPRVRFK